MAASIEAIFVQLGESDLLSGQDPILFDKMEETIVLYCNLGLGQYINTRKMTVKTPTEYVNNTVQVLQCHWHKNRKTFCINEMESPAGELYHISVGNQPLKIQDPQKPDI